MNLIRSSHRLSFYKEELAGETKNYIHIRAQTEGLPPIDVFRHLVQEVLNSARTIELTLSDDEELKTVWLLYLEVRAPSPTLL